MLFFTLIEFCYNYTYICNWLLFLYIYISYVMLVYFDTAITIEIFKQR